MLRRARAAARQRGEAAVNRLCQRTGEGALLPRLDGPLVLCMSHSLAPHYCQRWRCRRRHMAAVARHLGGHPALCSASGSLSCPCRRPLLAPPRRHCIHRLQGSPRTTWLPVYSCQQASCCCLRRSAGQRHGWSCRCPARCCRQSMRVSVWRGPWRQLRPLLHSPTADVLRRAALLPRSRHDVCGAAAEPG